MDYEKKYKDALERAKIELNADTTQGTKNVLMTVFPELKESEDEQIRKGIIDFLWKEKIFLQEAHSSVENNPKYRFVMDAIAWLEKQKSVSETVERCKNSWYNEGKIAGMAEGLTNDEKYQQGWHDALEKQGDKSVEPNWCHHKVDLSDCTEEYRKAYYDGWNNCNQQYSQCELEKSDVLKCLINGMKFYYEDNEEAMWGTEKFSMKVKDILAWLEKQSKQKEQLINKACDVLVNCIEDFMIRRMEIWDEECKKQTLENIRKTLEE